MGKYSKFVGAGLGWIFGGPIGALLGFSIGSLMDEVKMEMLNGPFTNKPLDAPGYKSMSDASVSLLVLAAAVMRADKKVKINEMQYVRQFFTANYGDAFANERMPLFEKIVRQHVPLQEVCTQIRNNTTQAARLQLMHFMFAIAKADGDIVKEELDLIHSASTYLDINRYDYESVKAMFYDDTDKHYKILEVTQDASEDDIKKAYRTMAMKYHPDKVAGLGEEFEKAAKEKFQAINDAFNAIKNERGFM